MNTSTRWLGWTAIVLVGHMTEQLMFGLVELQRLKYLLGTYDGLFTSVDTATVVLVTVVATLVYALMFSLLKGGLARLVALDALGLVSVSEIHHLIETIAARAYTPGLITSIPYVACGIMLMRAATKEYRSDVRPQRLTRAAIAGLSIVLLVLSPRIADAQSETDATGKGELTRKLANPLANLVSVPLQTTWTSGMGPTDDAAFVLRLQPVVPFPNNEHWNGIGRMILPVISQPALGPTMGAASGIGDIDFSAFVARRSHVRSHDHESDGIAPVYAMSLRVCSASTSLMRVWYPTRRRRASLRNDSSTRESTRIAISCRGSLPSGGRPTRRIAFNCSGDDSGISE